MTQFFFILSCVAVPILWGIAVNWLFGRLQRNKPASDKSLTQPESTGDGELELEQDEPVIEYYI